ncbi:hypothetical protein HKX48_003235 [Thoreauomyces humboldtii]|nr:hypothetical protein HKX48_003235 [Thoreauomyces humboldtii]
MSVPAMADPNHERRMRRVLQNIDLPHKHNISFIPEPVAVALDLLNARRNLPDGTVTIHDMGGGTTDVISMDLVMADDGKWRADEWDPPIGYVGGGLLIDEDIEKALNTMLSMSTATERAHIIATFRNSWPRFKLCFDGLQDLRIPNTNVTIPCTTVAAAFDKAVRRSIDVGKKSFSTFQCLAGALAQSHYVQKLFFEAFEPTRFAKWKRKAGERGIWDPLLLNQTVLLCIKGALIYGQNPNLIGRRCLQRSYGIMASYPVDDMRLALGADPVTRYHYRLASHVFSNYTNGIERVMAFKPLPLPDMGRHTRSVETGVWYDVDKLLPAAVDIHAQEVVYFLATCELPITELCHYADLPDLKECTFHRFKGVGSVTEKMKIRFRFGVSGVEVQAGRDVDKAPIELYEVLDGT